MIRARRRIPVVTFSCLLLASTFGPGCTTDFNSGPGTDDGGVADAGPGCGNGSPDPGEECDDGTQNSDLVPNACRSNCLLPWCGDNVIDADEECDDGPSNSDTLPNACRTTCVPAMCGDGIVDTGEACDDGNDIEDDGCRNNCSLSSCGDGVLQTGEECDDGAQNSDTEPDACRTTCMNPACGDGVADSGEACDDGNASDSDACLNDCTAASCGDGIQWIGQEDCDDGNTNNNDDCPSTCQTAHCGDGYVWTGHEQCDDGNASNNDACLNTCVSASCGDGYVWSGQEQCDDGDTSNTDACLNNCQNASCGDGYVWGGQEDCDDGNSTSGDGCSASCDNENLPALTWLSSTSTGWTTPWVMYYAGEPHAPTTPIQAALSVEGAGRVIFFTQSTYHVLRIPQLTWHSSGTISADFPQLAPSGPNAGYGLVSGGGTSTTLTFIVGHWAYLYEYYHSTGNVTYTLADDINFNDDWQTPEAPDPNQVTAMFLDMDNNHSWVTDSLITACGVSGMVVSYSISITSSTVHTQEIGHCFDFYDSGAYGSFPPFAFNVSGRPTQSSIRGLFYYDSTDTLYAVTQ